MISSISQAADVASQLLVSDRFQNFTDGEFSTRDYEDSLQKPQPQPAGRKKIPATSSTRRTTPLRERDPAPDWEEVGKSAATNARRESKCLRVSSFTYLHLFAAIPVSCPGDEPAASLTSVDHDGLQK